MLVILFVCPVLFLIADFSPVIRARIFKFCMHPDNGEVYCVRENQGGEIFFLLSIAPMQHLRKFACTKLWFNIPLIAMVGSM